jgi:hypothetical protein
VTAPRFKGIFAGPIDIDRKAANATYPLLPATAGIIVTHRATGQSGIIIEASASAVRLRLPTGGVVMLALRKGAFEVDGRVVTLTRPTGGRPMAPRVTASGSIAANRQKAQVARASRIWVEGVHDAELIEKIWGDDLRSVGIVVEAMNGMDDLVAEVGEFLPSRTRRLGVLLDHLLTCGPQCALPSQALVPGQTSRWAPLGKRASAPLSGQGTREPSGESSSAESTHGPTSTLH